MDQNKRDSISIAEVKRLRVRDASQLSILLDEYKSSKKRDSIQQDNDSTQLALYTREINNLSASLDAQKKAIDIQNELLRTCWGIRFGLSAESVVT
ncbi:MAG: hypothetical protein EOP45_11615 [Sphingobacteriaceae bacterium]|nr:MAG: hypothetical protein EOP45_11615 [Sphingobacteriaceae bacterium]